MHKNVKLMTLVESLMNFRQPELNLKDLLSIVSDESANQYDVCKCFPVTMSERVLKIICIHVFIISSFPIKIILRTFRHVRTQQG